MRFRALVLAAGYGTRLAPLTDQVPKTLTPVRGTTPLELALRRLAAAGCEAVAVNTHHLGEAVRRAIGPQAAGGGSGTSGEDPRWPGMEVRFSDEPEILGTFGALRPLTSFFAPADAVVVINGDSLCRWPIRGMLRRHRRRDAVATLLFTKSVDPRSYGGGVAVGKNGRVRSFDPPGAGRAARTGAADDEEKGLRRLVFAGAQVLSPDLLARVPQGPSETVPTLFRPLLQEGAHVAAFVSGRAWFDLGTPRRLRDAALAGGAPTGWLAWSPVTPGSWVAPGAEVVRGARITRTVVEDGAVVEAGARLRRCTVLPGARIAAGARLGGCVVGYGAVIPGTARVSARLICRRTADASVPAGASVVEDLIYAPLDPQRRDPRPSAGPRSEAS